MNNDGGIYNRYLHYWKLGQGKFVWKPSPELTPKVFFLVKEAGNIPTVRNFGLS